MLIHGITFITKKVPSCLVSKDLWIIHVEYITLLLKSLNGWHLRLRFQNFEPNQTDVINLVRLE